MAFIPAHIVPSVLPESDQADDSTPMVYGYCTDSTLARLQVGDDAEGMSPEDDDFASPVAISVNEHPSNP